MILQFLVTVATPVDLPAERTELIRQEVEAHAGACVEFYGRVKPDKVLCFIPNQSPTALGTPLLK